MKKGERIQQILSQLKNTLNLRTFSWCNTCFFLNEDLVVTFKRYSPVSVVNQGLSLPSQSSCRTRVTRISLKSVLMCDKCILLPHLLNNGIMSLLEKEWCYLVISFSFFFLFCYYCMFWFCNSLVFHTLMKERTWHADGSANFIFFLTYKAGVSDT